MIKEYVAKYKDTKSKRNVVAKSILFSICPQTKKKYIFISFQTRQEKKIHFKTNN